MTIALFGAGGMIGRRIAEEALARGHRVTAIARDPAKARSAARRLAATTRDVLDPASIAGAVAGHVRFIESSKETDLIIRYLVEARVNDTTCSDRSRGTAVGSDGRAIPQTVGRG